MEGFLRYLAKQQQRYSHYLYNFKPQAYTNEECFERIEIKSKYEELLSIIAHLPDDEQIKVHEFYKQIS